MTLNQATTTLLDDEGTRTLLLAYNIRFSIKAGHPKTPAGMR